MKNIWVDVDTQNTFASEDGNLSVANAEANAEILRIISEIKGEPLIGSVDAHSYDSLEFVENGGPFPPHAVKGTHDQLKIPGTLPEKFRMVPPTYNGENLVKECLGGVGIYFEKDLHGVFDNPLFAPFVKDLVKQMDDEVTFRLFGYCTGQSPDGGYYYCVGAMAKGLALKGYSVEIITSATVPLGDLEGSVKALEKLGVRFV